MKKLLKVYVSRPLCVLLCLCVGSRAAVAPAAHGCNICSGASAAGRRAVPAGDHPGHHRRDLSHP